MMNKFIAFVLLVIGLLPIVLPAAEDEPLPLTADVIEDFIELGGDDQLGLTMRVWGGLSRLHSPAGTMELNGRTDDGRFISVLVELVSDPLYLDVEELDGRPWRTWSDHYRASCAVWFGPDGRMVASLNYVMNLQLHLEQQLAHLQNGWKNIENDKDIPDDFREDVQEAIRAVEAAKETVDRMVDGPQAGRPE